MNIEEYKMKYLECVKSIVFGDIQYNNVYYGIYPFSKLCRLFGFYPVSLKSQNGEVCFSYSKEAWFYSVALFIVYAVGFSVAVRELKMLTSSNDIEYTVIAYFTAWVQIYSLFTLGIVALLSSWQSIGPVLDVIKDVHNIDISLEKIGSKVCYKKFKLLFYGELLLLLVIPTFFSMVNCFILKVTTGRNPRLCYTFICYAPISLILLKEIQFCNFMILFKEKFDLINQQLKLFGKILPNTVSLPSGNYARVVKDCDVKGAISFEVSFCNTLKKLSQIYGAANDAANKVLKVFSPHMLFMTVTSLCVLTIQCYNLYAYLANTYDLTAYEITATIIWIVLHGFVIFVNCAVCSKTTEAMTETSLLLHKIRWLSEDDRCAQAVQLFSLEIMHRNKNFSVGGFFNLDNKLITSVLAAVTTYLVIIIQFHNGSKESILNGTYTYKDKA